jgi:hypothetical protein
MIKHSSQVSSYTILMLALLLGGCRSKSSDSMEKKSDDMTMEKKAVMPEQGTGTKKMADPKPADEADKMDEPAMDDDKMEPEGDTEEMKKPAADPGADKEDEGADDESL